jgi:hypothetical protein
MRRVSRSSSLQPGKPADKQWLFVSFRRGFECAPHTVVEECGGDVREFFGRQTT